MPDESEFDASLFVDLYELTMLQAYHAEGMTEPAVFSLFVRELPAGWHFLLAAGLEDALAYLETLQFDETALSYLESLGLFRADFLEWLGGFRFTGDVHAVPEGTPIFPDEPLLEVEGPVAEAQFVETFLLNQLSFQTLVASKGVRSVLAARGKPVIDFGARRSHGLDAAMKAARALHIAGFAGTSNVEAGRRYSMPVTGTMAHSYITAHESEAEAFRAFARLYPETVLLVDTYDTLEGVRRVIDLARELGDDFRVRAVRLDSGDLAALAEQSRALLDAAGLQRVRIVASGGLDEHAIADLEARRAPVDSYAVGTRVSAPADANALESAYKLVAYAGRGRRKLSTGKATLPGRKQVFRRFVEGFAAGDTIALADETLEGEPLLRPVMRGGVRTDAGREPLDAARARAAAEVARLPDGLRSLDPGAGPYGVEISDGLRAAAEAVDRDIEMREGHGR